MIFLIEFRGKVRNNNNNNFFSDGTAGRSGTLDASDEIRHGQRKYDVNTPQKVGFNPFDLNSNLIFEQRVKYWYTCSAL